MNITEVILNAISLHPVCTLLSSTKICPQYLLKYELPPAKAACLLCSLLHARAASQQPFHQVSSVATECKEKQLKLVFKSKF